MATKKTKGKPKSKMTMKKDTDMDMMKKGGSKKKY